MKLARIALSCTLAAAMGPALSEQELPSAAEFVAAMELSIEVCSARHPDKADAYTSLRPIANTMFAKRNYADHVGTQAYIAHRRRLEQNLETASPSEVEAHCKVILKLLAFPEQGVMFHD